MSGYPGVTFRGQLPPETQREFDALTAQLEGFLRSAGFEPDGTFTRVVTGELNVDAVETDVLLLTLNPTPYAPFADDGLMLGAANASYSFHRLTPTAARDLYGIEVADTAVGNPGQVLILFNDSLYTLAFIYSAASGARRLYGCSPPVSVPPGGIIAFIYDSVNLGWRLLWASRDNSSASAGDIKAVAYASGSPSGWLECDGSQYSETTYAALYAAIGTTWNTGGESAGNFRVPDFRGHALLHKASAGTGSTFAGKFGALDHTHTVTIAADGSHTHSVTPNAMATQYDGGAVNTPAAPTAATTDDPGDHSHSGSSVGGANPPLAVVRYFIKY